VIARQQRRAGRPAAAASAETRDRILRAAMRCFATGGYGRTSNRQIAESAGVTSPALYHYFDSKADLYAAVHDHGLEAVLHAYRDALGRHDGSLDQLCALVEASIDLNRAHPGLAEFLAITPLELDRHSELPTRLRVSGESVRKVYREVLERGVARGELPEDLAVDTVVDLLTATNFGLHCFFGPLDKPDQHQAVLRAFQSLLRGVLLDPKGHRIVY
jgi:AcrR family transcriptional regulator